MEILYRRVMATVKAIVVTSISVVVQAFLTALTGIIFALFIFINNGSVKSSLSNGFKMLEKYNTYVYTGVVCIVAIFFYKVFASNIRENNCEKLSVRSLICISILGILISILVNIVPSTEENVGFEMLEAIVYIIDVVVIVPLYEEIVYRRYLFWSLEEKMGWKYATITSSIVFAVSHGNVEQFLYTLPVGLCFAYVCRKYGYLGSWLMHGCFNLTALMVGII